MTTIVLVRYRRGVQENFQTHVFTATTLEALMITIAKSILIKGYTIVEITISFNPPGIGG